MRKLFTIKRYITRQQLVCLLLSLGFSWTLLLSQNPLSNTAPLVIDVQHFNIEDGLSHRYVTSIHQDKNGFMWFGTQYGLNRFDGYDFKWFTAEKNGLQNNEIDHVLLDSEDRMWLIHTGSPVFKRVKHIDIFDPETEAVISFEEAFSGHAPFRDKDVIAFARNSRGHLAFLTATQLVTYTGRFQTYPIAHYDAHKMRQLCWADDGRFWLAAYELGQESAKLLVLTHDGKLEQQFEYPPNAFLYLYDLDQPGRASLYVLQKEQLIEQSKSRYLSVYANGKEQPDQVMEKMLSGRNLTVDFTIPILQKYRAQYWVQTIKDEFALLSDQEAPRVLSETYPTLRNPTCVYTDRSGAVWVGSQFGIHRLKLEKPRFRTFLSHPKTAPTGSLYSIRGMTVTQDLNQNTLWAMAEEKGQLWKIDLNTGQETLFATMDENRWAVTKQGNKHLLYAGVEGIHRIDSKTGSLLHTYPFDLYKEPYGITFIHEDKYGKVWFDNSFDGNLTYFANGHKRKFIDWTTTHENLYTYQFLEDETDTAWLGTSQGMFRLNIQTGEVVERFWKNGKGKYQLPFDHVHHFRQNEDGSFWLATAGEGLIHWHPEKGVLTRYTHADGLPNNTIYAIYPDDYGNFWLPTDIGICVFNATSKQVRLYTPKDGLSHTEFNRIAHCQDDDGNIYFGSLNGITTFHPKDFVADSATFQAPLVITGFQQFDGRTGMLVDKAAELRRTNLITMRPNDRLIRLQLSLLTMEDMQNVRYAYRLEGVDREWTYQTENNIRLGRLPYGKHILHLKSQASNGQWSAQELRIQIHALKPVYQQAWFLALLGLLLLGGTFLFFRQREKSLKAQSNRLERTVRERTATIEQQKEKLQSLDELKSKFFANVSHELRTPLTLILGPIETLLKENRLTEKQASLLKMANQGSKNLKNLVNEILDLSKLEAGKMGLNPSPALLASFFNHYCAQFESLAAHQEITYVHQVGIAPHQSALIDREKCRQLIFNLLSNAFKFTPPGGKIAVRVGLEKGELSIQVADSGKGIHPADLPHIFDRYFQTSQKGLAASGGTGIGLALCQEYTQLFGGSITVESTWAVGSTFQVQFPVAVGDVAADLVADPAFVTDLDFVKEKTASTVAAAAVPLVPEDTPARPTILLVEDNPHLQDYICLILQDQYQVVTADNGQKALEIIGAHLSDSGNGRSVPIDLILSDLMMPVMDGYQLLEQLKASADTQSIPTIMLTARADKDDRLKALRIGVDDYLTKPFDEEELKIRIRNLLQNRTARQAALAEARLQTDDPQLSQTDQELLNDLETFVRKHLSNAYFSVIMLADESAMSESTLLRQLKRLTGLSTQKYIADIRLNEARILLETRRYNSINRVAVEVGYTDVRIFSRNYKARFGKLPSEHTNN